MTRSELIQSVKVKIDELVPENELTIVTSANSSVNTIAETIDSFLNESARDVLKNAPIHLCPLASNTSIPTILDSVATIIMPDNFLRFGNVWFSVWKRVVSTFILVGSPEYYIQKNLYTRGGYNKPVVALGKDGSSIYIECFILKSADSGATRKINYVANPINAEALTDLTLLDSLQWLVASKTLQAFEKYDAMKTAFEQYQNILK